MYWQTWFYPLVEFFLMVYCSSRFRNRGGRSLSIAFGALLLSTMSWRIVGFAPGGYSEIKRIYEVLGYFNGVAYLFFAIFLIRGINELSGSISQIPLISGGVSVNPSRSDVTRHLAASAVLNGISYRIRILDHFKSKYKTFVREPGIDVPFLIRICKYFEQKETRYQIAFMVISIAYLLTFLAIASGEAFLLITLLFFAIAWGVSLYKERSERNWVFGCFQREAFNPDEISVPSSVAVDPEIAEFYSQNTQNLIVYDSFIPFVGNGLDLGGWSFAVDLNSPKDHLGSSLRVIPFALKEMYAAIDRSLQELEFPGLTTQDLLYVNGSDLRDKKWILADLYSRPITNIPADKVTEFMEENEASVRHYKCIQVADWGHELVVSYFLRLSRRGKDLFVEVSKFLLTPIDDQYRKVDTLTEMNWSKNVQLASLCLIKTPINGFAAWIRLFNQIRKFIDKTFDTEGRVLRRQIWDNPLYNYGASTTLRQEMSKSRFDHYFQRLDQEMYVKTIEREILATIIKFLDAHNIETSELKERQTTIINSGIIVQQGDVRAESVAVGAGAQARKTVKMFLGGRGKE